MTLKGAGAFCYSRGMETGRITARGASRERATRGRREARAPALAALLIVLLVCSGGCRAIRRHAESRQSIAARKLSREGLEAMHQGRWSQAEDLFATALALSEVDDRAHWGMAESLWQRGEVEAAVEHQELAVRLSGSDPELLLRLGRMYFDTGRYEEAQQQADEVLRSVKNSAAAWALRGEVLAQRGEQLAALAAYHRALALQNDYPAVQLAIAQLYYSQGRHDRLLATLDRLRDQVASEACPPEVHLLRGVAMRHLGRASEAAECFALAAAQSPGDPEVLGQLAEAQWEAGDSIAARAALDDLLRLQPDSEAARELRARWEGSPGRVARDPAPWSLPH
jgi:tetratricopeptide (TPR) repeat protein